MYIVNTFRWDFSKVAALVALRPLLISNTDNDTIFPLEGVVDIHRQVRHIYKLYQAEQNLGLQITEGPHADTQELHIHAFRWFNRFLRDDTTMIAKTADRYNDADWKASTAVRMESLPTDELPEAEISKFQHLRIHFDSQLHVPLFADVVLGPQESLSSIESATILVTADPIKAVSDAFSRKKSPLIVFCPRGMGPHSWIGNDAKQIQIARRFQLIGTTPDAMRVWDIRRAMQIVRDSCTSLRQPAHLTADQNIHLEAMTLLASLLPASIVQFERLPTPLESVAMA